MSLRVNESEVREIISTNRTNLSSFMKAANLIVTKKLTTVDDSTMKEVERWLTAHFIAVADGEKSGETIDGSTTYFIKTTMEKGLGCTSYGQQAMVLDYSGSLINMGKVKASFNWLGKDDSSVEI